MKNKATNTTDNEHQAMPQLMTLTEVAALLKLSPKTLYTRVARRAKRPFPVRPRRIGRTLRFDAAEIAAYLKSL